MTSSTEIRRLAVDVGYRMLGSHAEAEDIAQKTLLRALDPIERGEIDNPDAFVTTVATRLALDEIKSARHRRERYVGPWLPEPRLAASEDPVEMADEISYALLVLLDRLSPLERAAFLLREAFAFSYDEIGEVLARTPTASRQLVSRARRHVRDERPVRDAAPDPVAHRELLERFLTAADAGDFDGLLALLGDDVELVHDGGPARRAARHPIRGRVRVARYLSKVFPKITDGRTTSIRNVNGQPGLIIQDLERIQCVGLLHASGTIHNISFVYNPEKLPDLTSRRSHHDA